MPGGCWLRAPAAADQLRTENATPTQQTISLFIPSTWSTTMPAAGCEIESEYRLECVGSCASARNISQQCEKFPGVPLAGRPTLLKHGSYWGLVARPTLV